MKKIIKENWKFLLLVLLGGLIGGYCTGIYYYNSLSSELLKQIQEQNITKEILGVSSSIQYGILYGIILAGIGIFLSKKIDLWNDFKIDKKNIVLEACYDNIKEDKDLLIGFDPDVVNKNRIEL